MSAPHRLPRPARRLGPRQDGMTLIEVLVTLVIISVGLLGVAALQLTTVRHNYESFVRSQAAMLASDILDRMRSNRPAAADYATAFGAVPNTNTPAGLDVQRWRDTLQAQLTNGRGQIEFNVDTRVVTVTIEWGERANVSADQTLQFRTSTQI